MLLTARALPAVVCPLLCSGNGEYRDGECHCKPEWKGRECSLRHDQCEVPDCNGHGRCREGTCRCAQGYKGEFCQQRESLRRQGNILQSVLVAHVQTST